MELLDLVDENNSFTGKNAPRDKIHKEGLWHRTVHIYLFQKSKKGIEFLVHLRSIFKDQSPNKWDTRFGGHIKTGETLEEGVALELKEEIGIDASDYLLIEGNWRKSDKFPNRQFSKTYFLEYKKELSKLKFNDGEVQEVKWMGVEEIKKAIVKNPNEWAAGLAGFIEVANLLKEKIKDFK